MTYRVVQHTVLAVCAFTAYYIAHTAEAESATLLISPYKKTKSNMIVM